MGTGTGEATGTGEDTGGGLKTSPPGEGESAVKTRVA